MISLQLRIDTREITNALSDMPFRLLGAAVAIGFLAMALIEMYKPWLRKSFHRHCVQYWLSSYRKIPFLLSLFIRGKQKNERETEDLVLLSTAGDHNALFRLSVENLCGQVLVAAQTVLESPNAYKQLLRSMIGDAMRKKEVKEAYYRLILTMGTDMDTGKKEHTDTDRYPHEERHDIYEDDNPYEWKEIFANEKYDEDMKMNKYIEAKNRIASCIQRNIDSLQINTGFGWSRTMRINALVISFAITSLGCWLFLGQTASPMSCFLFIILIGFTGAFFASFISNIAGILEKYKR